MRRSTRAARTLPAAIAALAVLCLGSLGSSAQPQPDAPVAAQRSGGRVAIDVTDLARRFGWNASDADGTLTLRTPHGILTAFDGAPDALWQAAGAPEATVVPLSMPPRRTDRAWFVPADLLQVLGVEVEGEGVEMPGGVAPLAFPPRAEAGDGFELAPLGPGMIGLRFFAPGPAGPDTVSLLLADLALLALAVPEHRAVLDAVLVDGPMADAHPLLVTVTAVAPMSWEPTLVFEQGDVRFEARHPFRFQLVSGSAQWVEPDAPAIGVVLLPSRLSLEQPLRVQWGDRTADVVFRPGR